MVQFVPRSVYRESAEVVSIVLIFFVRLIPTMGKAPRYKKNAYELEVNDDATLYSRASNGKIFNSILLTPNYD